VRDGHAGRRRLLRLWLPLAAGGGRHQPAAPSLPPLRSVDVPGRGAMHIRDIPGEYDDPPIILLHPWTWTSDVAFGAILELLPRGRRVITVDLRGHGRAPSFNGPPTTDEFVDDLLGLLDALAIERAVLIGHSLGGIVAMAAALRSPGHAAGLVIIAAAGCYTRSRRDRWFWRAFRAARPLAEREIGKSLALRYFLPASQAHHVQRQWAWLTAELGRNSVRTMWSIGAMVSQLDLRPALSAARSLPPAVYVVLTRDRVCGPFMQRETAALLSARMVELALDHDAPVAAPDRYAAALREALQILGPVRTLAAPPGAPPPRPSPSARRIR
jgi:pimeloyl-ACP methyl ester carboxylesterase